MSEYIKDGSEPSGWRTVSYEKTAAAGAPTADNMDEGGAEGSGGEEGPDRGLITDS